MLTVNELLSGIGTQSFALKYLGVPFKVVGISEIDKFAIQAYTALHGETRNYGNICEIDKLDYADLWTYSFPCTDISSAGKGKGLKEIDKDGNEVITRSGLLFEVERLLAKSCGFDIVNGELVKNESYEINPPKYLVLENVSELLKFKKHNVYFYKWLERLDELGYNSYYDILNAKYFGIPQNRERVFCLSVRKDVFTGDLGLPNINSLVEKPLKSDFKDFVEDSVLSYNGGYMIDESINPYLMPAFTRDILDISKSDKEIFTCECKSGFLDHRVGIKVAPTIRHQKPHTVIYINNQIHRLTARETWRFMGIKDKDFDKIKENSNISDSRLCALAGNAIVVPVLMSIFNQIWQIEQGKQPYGYMETPFLTVNVKEKV